MTVWPSAIWKSMCKGCGFLFLPGKVHHWKMTEQGTQQGRQEPLKAAFLYPLPSPLLSVVCMQFSQLFVFSNLGKNLPFSCWTTRSLDWQLSQFQVKTLGGSMLLIHRTVLPGWVARTGMCYRCNPHSSNTQKIGKIKYLPMETLTGNTSLINTEFACKIKA